jgi:hypothetical protein
MAENTGGTRVADEARMTISKMAFIASLGLIGCVSSRPPLPVSIASHERTLEERHVYRVEFVVAANDPGKPAQTSAYTLNLEEHDVGEVRMGTNIAISPQARQDVGLKIQAHVFSLGDDLLMRDEIEMSGAEDGSTAIHKVTTMGGALLKTGQQTLVASLEDPLSHKHYQVSASATRLR